MISRLQKTSGILLFFVLEKVPAEAYTHESLGDTWMALEKCKEAENYFKKAHEIDPFRKGLKEKLDDARLRLATTAPSSLPLRSTEPGSPGGRSRSGRALFP